MRSKLSSRIFSIFLIIIFACQTVFPVYAQMPLMIPAPGSMVLTTPAYAPSMLQGMIVDLQHPFDFDFILVPGQQELDQFEMKEESQRLIRYFLAALTLPEEELWVNLSPYEENRIVSNSLGVTELGRDLLAQDYLLKQLSASLTHPDQETGKKFWEMVRAKVMEKFGMNELPMDNFTKVWIIPDTAKIYENQDRVFITESHLKVMTEQDYLALRAADRSSLRVHGSNNEQSAMSNELTELQTQIMRDVIIPEIEKEVNEGKTFAPLRQIYTSFILAVWYKQHLKETFLGQHYFDQKKIKGIDLADKQFKQQVYDQYIAALKKGVYSFIKEDFDLMKKEYIPRHYFSGGVIVKKPKFTKDIYGDIPRSAVRIKGYLGRPDEAMLVSNADPYKWSFGDAFDNVPQGYWDNKIVFGAVDYNVKVEPDGKIEEKNKGRLIASIPMLVRTIVSGGRIILSSHRDDPYALIKAGYVERQQEIEKAKARLAKFERQRKQLLESDAADFYKKERKANEARKIIEEFESKTEDQHVDEIKTIVFEKETMQFIAVELEKLINAELEKSGHAPIQVHFSHDWQTAKQALAEIESFNKGDVILLENSRFDEREMALHKAKTSFIKIFNGLRKEYSEEITEDVLKKLLLLVDEIEFNYSLHERDLRRSEVFVEDLGLPSGFSDRLIEAIQQLYDPLAQHTAYQEDRYYGVDAAVFEGAAVMHRGYASTLIPDYLPAFIGPLVLKELTILEDIKLNLETAVIGGKNIKSLKEKLIDLTPGLLNAPQLKNYLSMGQVGLVFLKAAGKKAVENIDLKIAEAEVKDMKKKYYEKLEKEFQEIEEGAHEYHQARQDYLAAKADYENAAGEYRAAEKKYVDFAKALFQKNAIYAQIIRAPMDLVLVKNGKKPEAVEIKVVSVDDEADAEWDFLDIGPKTIEYYREIILNSRYAFWNGPGGQNSRDSKGRFNTLTPELMNKAIAIYTYESSAPVYFSGDSMEETAREILLGRKGSFEIVRAFAESAQAGNTMVAGGGGTSGTVSGLEFERSLSYVLTGGGSSLKYLSGAHLPAYEALIQHGIPKTLYDYYRIRRMLENGGLLEKGTFAAIVHRGMIHLFDQLEQQLELLDQQTGLELAEKKMGHVSWFRRKLEAIDNPLPFGKDHFEDGDQQAAEKIYGDVQKVFSNPEFSFEELFEKASIQRKKIQDFPDDKKLLESVQQTVEQINYLRLTVWNLYYNFIENIDNTLSLDVDLNLLIQQVIDNLYRADDKIAGYLKKGLVTIKVDLSQDIPHIIAPTRRFRDTLRKIIRNAIWASVVEDAEGGPLTLLQIRGGEGADEPQEVFVRTRLNKYGEIVIEVQDQGVGMSQQDLRSAMNYFYSKSLPIKQKKKPRLYHTLFGEQSGNGLPAFKSLMDHMGGRLDVESSPDKGTVVTARIPFFNRADNPELNKILLEPSAIAARANGNKKRASNDEAMLTDMTRQEILARNILILARARYLRASSDKSPTREDLIQFLIDQNIIDKADGDIRRLLISVQIPEMPDEIFYLADTHSRMKHLDRFMSGIEAAFAKERNIQINLLGDILDKDLLADNLEELAEIFNRLLALSQHSNVDVQLHWGNNEVQFIKNVLEFYVEVKESHFKGIFETADRLDHSGDHQQYIDKEAQRLKIVELIGWFEKKGFLENRSTSGGKIKGAMLPMLIKFLKGMPKTDEELQKKTGFSIEQVKALRILEGLYKQAQKERPKAIALAKMALKNFQYANQDALGFLLSHTLPKKKIFANFQDVIVDLDSMQKQVLDKFDALLVDDERFSSASSEDLVVFLRWHSFATAFTEETLVWLDDFVKESISDKGVLYRAVESNPNKLDSVYDLIAAAGSITGHIGIPSFFVAGLRAFIIGIHGKGVKKHFAYMTFDTDMGFNMHFTKKKKQDIQIASIDELMRSIGKELSRAESDDDQDDQNDEEDQKDEAMLQGGIDLNAELLQIKSEGAVINRTSVDEAFIVPADFTIDGLVPVIQNIAPILNLPQVLGYRDREGNEQDQVDLILAQTY